jgi:ParB-like chromosome segregation protein Spo0J
MKKRELKKVGIDQLKQHRVHGETYSTTDVKQLSVCINATGLMQQIIVNKSFEVLCGWRRLQALIILGITDIEVMMVDIPKEDEAAFIVNSNTHRTKKNMDIYHELKILKAHWAKKPGHRTDLQQGLNEEEMKQTRNRIADAIGINPTRLYRIEVLGDFDIKLLEIVDGPNDVSLSEACKSIKPPNPVKENDIRIIDLNLIKPCPCCGNPTRRIDLDDDNNLIYA